jgi:predicted adenylyl cyclase CyaB
MAYKNIEIEIQVNIKDTVPLREFLKKNGVFQGEKYQVDEYFSPKRKGFLNVRPVAEWLRLRNADGKHSINYKKWHYDKYGKSHYCNEFESRIDDINKIKKILFALDFVSITRIDKLRKIYKYKDYEIAIDSVKKLGDFVEIEYIGKNTNIDPQKITRNMVALLKKIGCKI